MGWKPVVDREGATARDRVWLVPDAARVDPCDLVAGPNRERRPAVGCHEHEVLGLDRVSGGPAWRGPDEKHERDDSGDRDRHRQKTGDPFLPCRDAGLHARFTPVAENWIGKIRFGVLGRMFQVRTGRARVVVRRRQRR